MINFLEVFQITFAIYAEDTEYNLVKVSSPPDPAEMTAVSEPQGLETFRVFSQTLDQPPQFLPENPSQQKPGVG